MKQMDLGGIWQMRAADTETWLDTAIPGSVAATLLAHGRMEDPYDRENEAKVQAAFELDYEFRRVFAMGAEALAHDRVLLHCDGLDTLATLTLNGQEIGRADNMHRTWVFDIKDALRVGENTLSVRFASPVRYLEEHPSQTGRKFATLRKAACMFGWDWGLNLPDSGIWRDIYIETFDHGRLDTITLRQRHLPGHVDLCLLPRMELWGEGVTALIQLTNPDGTLQYNQTMLAQKGMELSISIESPELWWPVGYGEQPLYGLRVVLQKDGVMLDERKLEIGLRTLTLNRDKRPGGSNYGFVVNGMPIFFKGENLIIEDAIISRTTPDRWSKLLENCLRSNLNGIRVWGGAYYPPDGFYEQCDRLGLLVWQDFMFACTFYMPTDEFLSNVRREIADTLSRIAHHACLALLCGNNEVESMYTVMGSREPETVALRKLFGRAEGTGFFMRQVIWHIYSKLFLKTIPPLCADYAPDTSYVHSSPSTRRPRGAKSFFDYLRDGDMHYYLQYNGNAPYQKLRTINCRFMTEMGFQSYPSMKTIAAFAREEDLSPYSPVMYAHQKCKNGNEAIELYMERDYLVPRCFEDYVYLSQLQAGEIMGYSVEHLRRQSGYCNGMIIWQLNDCWPVVSWSGIDYFGRWKAQQYYTRRFFEPVLLSALDEGGRVELWVTNNSPAAAGCTVFWALRTTDGTAWQEGQIPVQSPAGDSRAHVFLDFTGIINDHNRRKVYLDYHMEQGGRALGHGTTLFCLPKEYAFVLPNIRLQVEEGEDAYIISVSTDTFTRGLALDIREGDGVLSDNFFDLSPGETRTLLLKKRDISGMVSAQTLEQNLVVTCLNRVLADAAKA